VQKLAAERSLWRGYRRFEPRCVAKAGRSAIPFDLLLMNLQDFIQRQEDRLR
jgi:hypothetical protein